MGADVSSIDYLRMPDAVLVFGPTTDISTLDDVRATVSKLKEVVSLINTAIIHGQRYINFLSPPVVQTAGYTLKFFSILNDLLAEANALHKTLGKLEQNIYSTLLEGKLNALRNQLAILQDANTGNRQKVSELSVAISHFHEILPIFNRESSILYKKYYIGAQLFVPICGIFKCIALIAENTPEYSNPGLRQLKDQYRSTLKSLRDRCIRARLESIHMKVVGGSMMDMYPNEYFKDQLCSNFPEYFGSDSESEEFTLKCGRATSFFLETMPMLLDKWDPRTKSQINFCTVTLYKEETRDLSEAMLSRKAVSVYRTNVKTVMEDFFDIIL